MKDKWRDLFFSPVVKKKRSWIAVQRFPAAAKGGPLLVLVSCHSLVGRATTWREILIFPILSVYLLEETAHSSLPFFCFPILLSLIHSWRLGQAQMAGRLQIYFIYLGLLFFGFVLFFLECIWAGPGGRHSSSSHLSSSQSKATAQSRMTQKGKSLRQHAAGLLFVKSGRTPKKSRRLF